MRLRKEKPLTRIAAFGVTPSCFAFGNIQIGSVLVAKMPKVQQGVSFTNSYFSITLK